MVRASQIGIYAFFLRFRRMKTEYLWINAFDEIIMDLWNLMSIHYSFGNSYRQLIKKIIDKLTDNENKDAKLGTYVLVLHMQIWVSCNALQWNILI